MKKPNPLLDFTLLLLAGWLMFGGNIGGCNLPIIGEPPPFKADKLCVLVLEETKERGSYTAGQREAMLAKDGAGSIRAYVEAKGGEYMLWDVNQQPTSNTLPWIAEALQAAQPNQLPWIVAATPNSGFTKQLPKEATETVADLQKIGGSPKSGTSSYIKLKTMGTMP